MKRILLTTFCLIITVLTANAYESDSHFDMMYHLSRSSGLNDGMAKMMALANQHIDEGLISSPMLLSVQRQLFHFPGDVEKVEIEGHGAISLPSRIFKSKLALAERNSAIGNYLIYLGLKNGDLLLVGLGMHIKMDTYGHAGHSNILGHMEAGHNPDRAFLETKKYEDMIRSIIQSLVAVRKLLPEEAVDLDGALRYLNKFAKSKTHLKRDLVKEDLEDATKISGVLLEDSELQSIYREDMFRKYEYKRLALEKIYEKFHREGIIKNEITFDELFPEYLMHDPRLSVKDIIKTVIITTTEAEFLKAEGGKEIFDLRKLFGIKSDEIFLKKHKVEVERAEFRLRQLFHNLASLEAAAKNYKIDLTQMDMIIEEFNSDVRESLANKVKPQFSDIREYLASKLNISVSDVRSIYYLNLRVAEEREQLLKGVGISSQFEEGSEEFIKLRSHEIAEFRMAEEIAIRLTKDLVPSERTEYIKQNFEGETTNRQFEKEYKATAYRLHRLKNWGVNFYHGEGAKGFIMKFKEALVRFKQLITRSATPKLIEEWERLANESAAKFLQITEEMASKDLAESVGFTKELKSEAFRKLLRYVGPAIVPWLYFKKSGFSYIKGLIANAKTVAKDHEVEDIREAAKEGKYSQDPLNSKTSKNVLSFVKNNNRPAKFRCEALFAN